jgi:hypothetical protein
MLRSDDVVREKNLEPVISICSASGADLALVLVSKSDFIRPVPNVYSFVAEPAPEKRHFQKDRELAQILSRWSGLE